MKTNKKNPPGMGKLMKLCCLVLAAFLGYTANVKAQADDCSGLTAAHKLTIGADCVKGNNFTATFNASDPGNCLDAACQWLDEPTDTNFTVWYWFVVPAGQEGIYTISTDNVDPNHGFDTQIKLLQRNSSDCDMTLLQCNDDASTSVYVLGSIITATLVADTYYVAVDGYGQQRGEWCINVFRNAVPNNDCVLQATDLASVVDDLGSCQRFASAAYIYNAPSNPDCGTDPGDVSPGIDYVPSCSGMQSETNCDNPLLTGPNTPQHRGVWFKVKYDASNPVWVSAYPNNGGQFYTITAFEKTSAISGCETITGLCYLACSTGDDGTRTNADPADKAKCNNYLVPKLDLTGLVTPGDTIWLRVSEYGTALITVDTLGGDTAVSLADADPGIFNLVIEPAPSATAASNGLAIGEDNISRDRCFDNLVTVGCTSTEMRNFDKTYACLSNAGMQGNYHTGAFPLPGGSCAARTDEPLQYNYNGTTGLKDCTDPVIWSSGKTINNSAIYQFRVAGGNGEIQVPTGLCERLLAALGLLPPSVLVGNAEYQIVKSQLIALAETLCVVVDTALCATLDLLIAQLPPALQPVIDLLKTIREELCSLTAEVPCGAYLTLEFSNIKYAGINWGGMNIEVISECGGSAVGLAGGFTNQGDGGPGDADDCVTLYSTGFLPAGFYKIVVDGDGGNVAQYDMNINVQYRDTISGIACGLDCNSTDYARKPNTVLSKLSAQFGFSYVRPNPATNNMEIAFTSDVTGPVSLRIIDLTGRVTERTIEASVGANAEVLNVSELPAGVYILSLQNANTTIQTKFVKIDE